ncbi:MAG: phosphate acyltransferase [Defluviitaleaceae bacterium]|nr:phosphate acyltransferase [Defluviitaleaceae bacterium]
MSALDVLLAKRQSSIKTVIAVAAAQDEHVLESVVAAADKEIADFILVGDIIKIKEILLKLNVCETRFILINADTVEEACISAVALVREGRANSIMKGVCETSTIMKAALDKERGIRGTRRFSHLAMFILLGDVYHKPLFVTDAAINIAPDFELKKEIIESAVEAVKRLGVKRPKVALIAAKEKSDPKMPVTLEYDELVSLNERGWLDADLQLLSLDGAVSKESCEIKGITGPVAGDADILFCPYIEAGNVLYKSLTQFARAGVGGVILGAKAPIILTSRSDSAENKLLSIALGALV